MELSLQTSLVAILDELFQCKSQPEFLSVLTFIFSVISLSTSLLGLSPKSIIQSMPPSRESDQCMPIIHGDHFSNLFQ